MLGQMKKTLVKCNAGAFVCLCCECLGVERTSVRCVVITNNVEFCATLLIRTNYELTAWRCIRTHTCASEHAWTHTCLLYTLKEFIRPVLRLIMRGISNLLIGKYYMITTQNKRLLKLGENDTSYKLHTYGPSPYVHCENINTVGNIIG